VTPYLSFLLSPFIELLQGPEEDSFGPLKLCVVQTLTKSINVDEGGSFYPPLQRDLILISSDATLTHSIPFAQSAFWRDDRLQQLMPILVALVPHASEDAPASLSEETSSDSTRAATSAVLVALADSATDDTLLKRLNLDVLMHTRADDARVRIFALQCARALWTAHGSKLIGAFGRPRPHAVADGGGAARFRVGDGNLHR